ncbi:MogA/MoaB family molybdenum cofactor biosynthesis protein [Halobacterium sp. R2-5]|uniref:MogA/MoaB family molybdenum cofactor biosynthesis protein n=1 Tax=Halobacterium sp. R2-5 TaxID=2715751 RepID=UPI0014219008|nr:MogA/MoaB family molybdenum cofactor biosynthesis protein [Halobacterium sp. R2-5]NIB99962.1 MogA/MoaB family molybdenum cofactor biosynthesis protein [Halobacterium sp. R2-5]
MVDFQSRETRRDDEPDEEPADDADGEPAKDEAHGDEHEHADDHDHHHHDVDRVGLAILTVSTSRSLDDDPAGDAIAEAFEADGHEVVTRELVRDSYDRVQSGIDNLASRDDVDVVVTTGGTGVTPDDVTVDAAEPLFNKELPGFGELFRRRSYEEIGEKVVATRATAGVTDGVLVFCLPGSENAARLGSEQVVVPEIGHLVGLASRDR